MFVNGRPAVVIVNQLIIGICCLRVESEVQFWKVSKDKVFRPQRRLRIAIVDELIQLETLDDQFCNSNGIFWEK